jgi:hypothetical protein
MTRVHYRRSALLLTVAMVVLLLGFGSGWLIAQRESHKADVAQQDATAAQQDAQQANTNEQAAKDYLKQACNQGLKSACHQLANLNRIPTPSAAPQEHEIQEPEIQDPEIQDPDTYCSDKPKRCQGKPGPPGPSGTPGASGRGLVSLTCNADDHFTASYSDGSVEELSDSQCVGKQGPKGEDAPVLSSVVVGQDGTLTFSFSDGSTQVYSICPEGSTYQKVTAVSPEGLTQTFYTCVTG